MKITTKRRAAYRALAVELAVQLGQVVTQATAVETEQPKPKRKGRVRIGPRPTRDRRLDPTHYVPIDEALTWTPLRVLRALRWLGWAEQADIVEAGAFSDDGRERNGISVALYAHRKAGRVEARELRGRQVEGLGPNRQYRITDAGRAWLVAQLQTDEERAAWEAAA